MKDALRLLVVAGALTCLSACSTTGSHKLTCQQSEVAPNSQPGSASAKQALDWYLAHGNAGLPRSGFTVTSHTAKRYIFANGDHQVAVGALPAAKGEKALWVVMLTYDCS